RGARSMVKFLRSGGTYAVSYAGYARRPGRAGGVLDAPSPRTASQMPAVPQLLERQPVITLVLVETGNVPVPGSLVASILLWGSCHHDATTRRSRLVPRGISSNNGCTSRMSRNIRAGRGGS